MLIHTLENKVAIYTGINNELLNKENLQKQLELVTLRLPALELAYSAAVRWRSQNPRNYKTAGALF